MATSPATEQRAFAAAHFALEIGHQPNGLIKTIEGGGIKVDVMTYQQGGNYERWRQLGKPKFEDIKIQIGMSTSAPYYSWISQFFTGKQDRRDGAIVAADFNYTERARREFKYGLIRDITLPALDANGKDALYMAISISVESIDYKPGVVGKMIDAQASGVDKTKAWKACDFKFNLGSFDTKAVNKIEALTIKQNIVEYNYGGALAATKTPSAIEFPTISFTIPESHVKTISEHFNTRGAAIKRESMTPIPEGSIEYLGSDKKVLGTLSFYNAQILNVAPDKSDSGSDAIKNVKVELMVENMAFKYEQK